MHFIKHKVIVRFLFPEKFPMETIRLNFLGQFREVTGFNNMKVVD